MLHNININPLRPAYILKSLKTGIGREGVTDSSSGRIVYYITTKVTLTHKSSCKQYHDQVEETNRNATNLVAILRTE